MGIIIIFRPARRRAALQLQGKLCLTKDTGGSVIFACEHEEIEGGGLQA